MTPKEAAQWILLDTGYSSPVPSVSELCNKIGIIPRLYDAKEGNLGCCGIRDGRPRIFVDEKSDSNERRFTMAHELGHILLGHVGSWQYETERGRRSVKDRRLPHNVQEQEADTFACVLLGVKGVAV